MEWPLGVVGNAWPAPAAQPESQCQTLARGFGFQVAWLGVQKQKADWGGLPCLFHCAHPRHAWGHSSHPGALSLQATLSRLPVVPHFHSSGLGHATRGPGGVCAGGLAWICSLLWFPRVLLQVVFHDVGVLTDKLFPVVEAMQKHFSAGSGTYYSDSIFFLSVAMHQIMPKGNLDAGPKPWFQTSVSFPLAPKRPVP